MEKIIGYLVKKNEVVVAVTADERKAMYIARNWKCVSYKITTIIIPMENPITECTIAYDGTL